jgi:hypothetical protein
MKTIIMILWNVGSFVYNMIKKNTKKYKTVTFRTTQIIRKTNNYTVKF